MLLSGNRGDGGSAGRRGYAVSSEPAVKTLIAKSRSLRAWGKRDTRGTCRSGVYESQGAAAGALESQGG